MNVDEAARDKLTAQLKGKLWYCVERQVNEETPFDTTYTPNYTNALVEMCYMQLNEMGKDLEAFARHAGRQTITGDDMALLLRKTPLLQESIIAPR
ncbi:MHF1 (YOL086W-A) [Zygosaccharomyces parabailii]|uniref:BN860_10660g1_1 n=1 Tax=Zygosaccharomyces bailii (strain CLIB 213 / ATCC 58445 / CBS 680 / BCRC 21525 / NBRC 1098 / NCYC 1416 / NRRL Y-2227) TaxID=1333698 RepID=A0A8J2X5A9_ZYGB2|nr:MHF1 (YOL086W-A) [Zygosaccharomyces parabailii]AQZ12027.1 MHF1 (YOL086W-A) [Zygosaccharomyces parabailii]CDF87623.1 BN860_10660g1_1 [Zygosaccharomyces bailii CLIB 213]SJM83369.1 related to Mhf1p [Zygosaccharomyces bailii]